MWSRGVFLILIGACGKPKPEPQLVVELPAKPVCARGSEIVIRGTGRPDVDQVSALGEAGLVMATGDFEIKIPSRAVRANMTEIEVSGTAGKEPFKQMVQLPKFETLLDPSQVQDAPAKATLETKDGKPQDLDMRFDGGDVVFELVSCLGVEVTSSQATIRADKAKLEVRVPARKLVRLGQVDLKVATGPAYTIKLDAKERNKLGPAYIDGFPATPIADAPAFGSNSNWVMVVKSTTAPPNVTDRGTATEVAGNLADATVLFHGTRVISRGSTCAYRGTTTSGSIDREDHTYKLIAYELKTGRRIDEDSFETGVGCPTSVSSDSAFGTLVPELPVAKLTEWMKRLK